MRSALNRRVPASLAILAAMISGSARLEGQEAPPEAEDGPNVAESRLVAVTVYQGTALVTREVDVPGGAGTIDLVVSPLPPETIDSSLYTEAAPPIRVLSTRYRTRAVREDTREEVRRREREIEQLNQEEQRLRSQTEVAEKDLHLLEKLEGFTAATLLQLTETGALDAESTIALADHIMSKRSEIAERQVDLRRQIEASNEALRFARRELEGLSAGSSREERDAVITRRRPRRLRGAIRFSPIPTRSGPAATRRSRSPCRSSTASPGPSARRWP